MPLSTQDLQDIIVNDAARLGNDPALMLALADHESGGFNPNALSRTGVRGLFQVTNATGAGYGQTPQTRSDPRVSSEAGQRYFKELLFKAGGDVPTALRWYNGGSDPQFAQRVQAKVAGHQARLGKPGSTDAIVQELYGPAPTPTAPAPAAAPTTDAIVQELYGPTPATPAPNPEGPFARYSGTPDLPLEEALNPLELGISGYGAKVGLGVAKQLFPTAGKVVQLGAQGLGLEVGHKVNQAVGNTPGSITDFGWPDVANFVIPYAQEGVVQAGKAALRLGRAGQAVQVADKATAAQAADYAAQVAADRGRLAADGSLLPVAPPPTPVQPTIKESGTDTYRRLGELGTGVLGAVYSGHPVKSVVGGAVIAGADKGYDAFSRWLLSPTPSPLLRGHAPLEVFRQAIGPSGDLNHKTMAVLYGLFTSGRQPENQATASPAGP